MQDEPEARIRKDLYAEIGALERRYETLKHHLATAETDDFEIVGALQAFRDDLTIVSATVLTLYQLKGQKTKITWDTLFTNIDTALETIQNSANPKPKVAIETALKMSDPRIEEVMDYLSRLKKSL